MRAPFKVKRKIGFIFSILGIILIFSSIIAVIWWETKGRVDFLYGEVLVLNQNVEANTTITEDMLGVIKIDPDSFIEGALVDKNEVTGKIAAHYIPKGSQLTLKYFVDESIKAVEEGFYIFSVPIDWIITFPSSLRGGDEIYFYPVRILESSKEGEGTNNYSNPISSTKIYREDNMVNCEVAYLKDSGNREVVTIAGEERGDASANIASIEIALDWEDISYLQDLYDSGYKFIILYKE